MDSNAQHIEMDARSFLLLPCICAHAYQCILRMERNTTGTHFNFQSDKSERRVHIHRINTTIYARCVKKANRMFMPLIELYDTSSARNRLSYKLQTKRSISQKDPFDWLVQIKTKQQCTTTRTTTSSS